MGIYEPDPREGWRQVERRLPYSRDFDPDLLLFDNYIPFNTVLVERELLLEAGPLDHSLPFFEDWELLIRLASLAPFHHLPQVTCEYRHFRSGGHQVFGEHPSERTDFLNVKARVLERHADRRSPEVLARVVDRLRAETVAATERERSRGLELARRVEERNALVAERDALAGELERHRQAVAGQMEHLEKLYAEVGRLTDLVAAMEGTKAWRLHRAIEKLRGRR